MATPRTDAKLTITVRTRVTMSDYEALERLADQDCSNVALIVRRFIRRQLVELGVRAIDDEHVAV